MCAGGWREDERSELIGTRWKVYITDCKTGDDRID